MVATALMFASCNKDDNHDSGPGGVSRQLQEAFESRYPGATNVNWSAKGQYMVADFSLATTRATASSSDHSAWFDNGGLW